MVREDLSVEVTFRPRPDQRPEPALHRSGQSTLDKGAAEARPQGGMDLVCSKSRKKAAVAGFSEQ